MIRKMPRIPVDSTRLMALLMIRDSGESVGVMADDETVYGIIMENVLIDHLMHPLGVPGTRGAVPPATGVAAAIAE